MRPPAHADAPPKECDELATIVDQMAYDPHQVGPSILGYQIKRDQSGCSMLARLTYLVEVSPIVFNEHLPIGCVGENDDQDLIGSTGCNDVSGNIVL